MRVQQIIIGMSLLQSNILWSAAQYAVLVDPNHPVMFYRVTVELDK